MGLAIALAVTIISGLFGYLFWARPWWFPVDISRHGGAIDHQFMVTLIITGVIFFAAQFLLAFAIWKHSRSGDDRKATYSHGNGALEITWTLAATVLFIGLNLMAYRTWAHIQFVGPQPCAMQIEVWGQQFAWYFRYPGVDGKFGPVHVERIDDAAGNYLGLDRNRDPASKDDIVTATLAFPVNREVQLILRSKDVIHSFYVRELRMKQDLVPGMEIPLHFTATQTGRYELACAELCGLGHYKMRAFVEVMTQNDFDAWLRNRAAEQ